MLQESASLSSRAPRLIATSATVLLGAGLLRGGLGEIPGAAALTGGLAAAVVFLLLPVGTTAPWWLVAAATGCACGLTRLLGTWCADPAAGFALTASAVLAGVALQSRTSVAEEGDALCWAAAAGLLAAIIPLLLRFLGLNAADPAMLEDPLRNAVFLLGQTWLAAALAAAAAAGAATASFIEPSVVLALGGCALALAAALRLRPWTRGQSQPLRARALTLAPVFCLALASLAPGLMRDVWTARLDAAYPGGRFLFLRDDGARVLAAYEFSIKDRTALRDGVIQSDDIAARLAVRVLAGQRFGLRRMLISRPPTPAAPVDASLIGLSVTLEKGTSSEAATLDALGGPRWREILEAPAPQDKPEAALLFLPRPAPRCERRRWAGAAALRALRARLMEGAPVAVLLPPGVATGEVEAAAREVFGSARTADVGRGVLVVAAPEIETDAERLYSRLPAAARSPDPRVARALAEALRWRPPPTAK
ncbi:MAG TPA: hypothetical protein DCZ01_06890 [Elusimicrobia bacterium]|nr:MAG: hypothetical protein A2X37_01705 [Elusimicrobia bacterium GWA2_66_18]HAZ08236.1 hypothetical protein [Elusimicrobiota bacterium]